MNDQQHYDDQHEQYMNELAQQMEQEQAFYDQQQQEQEQHMSAEQLAAGDAMYASAGIMQPGLHPQLGVDESGYVAPHYSVFYYRPGPVDPVSVEPSM